MAAPDSPETAAPAGPVGPGRAVTSVLDRPPRSSSGAVPRPEAPLVARVRSQVTAQLFPVGTHDVGRFTGPLVMVAASVLALLRVPVRDLDTIWAEDGHRFLQETLDDSFLSTIFQPYSGYFHLYPRVVAEFAALLPLQLAGYVFSIAAAVVVGLAAWSVWTFGAAHLPSPWLRAGLAAAVALLPAGGLEAVNNVANSHFYLMFAAFWALVGRARSTTQHALAVIIVCAATLSDPVSIVLLPLAIGRLAALPSSWRDRTIAVSYLVTIAAQLAVALSAERAIGDDASLRDIAFGYGLRVVAASVLALGGAAHLVSSVGPWAIWALGGAVAVTIVAAVALSRRRLIIAAAGLASLAFFVVASEFALGAPYPPSGALQTVLPLASRYTVVPGLLFVSAGLIVVQAVADAAGPVLRRAVVALGLAPILLYAVLDYRPPADQRDGMAPWSQQVEEAAEACSDVPLSTVEVLTVAPTAAWDVEVACSLLRDRAR